MELLPSAFDGLWDVLTSPGCLAEGEGPLCWSSREESERLLTFPADGFFFPEKAVMTSSVPQLVANLLFPMKPRTKAHASKHRQP